ncbi:MAG: hypothetical protein IPJ26_09155 [Bacteroidetes bacterium]|nr:hypothetical protein [Bacteroidota bacterium]
MAFQAPYLFAATPTGLFSNIDNGLNWKEVHGLPENTINGLAVKGNKIFAACYYSGLYVSNDFGATWEKAELKYQLRENRCYTYHSLL